MASGELSVPAAPGRRARTSLGTPQVSAAWYRVWTIVILSDAICAPLPATRVSIYSQSRRDVLSVETGMAITVTPQG